MSSSPLWAWKAFIVEITKIKCWSIEFGNSIAYICGIYIEVIFMLSIISMVSLSTLSCITGLPFKKLGWFVDERSLAHIRSVNLMVFVVSVTRCNTTLWHLKPLHRQDWKILADGEFRRRESKSFSNKSSNSVKYIQVLSILVGMFSHHCYAWQTMYNRVNFS